MKQIIRLDVSSGLYDYVEQILGVPSGEGVQIRMDDDKWQVIKKLKGTEDIEELEENYPHALPFHLQIINSPLEIDEDIDAASIHELIATEYIFPETSD
jgi:hypothetical protein